jgi:hypothetical protein
MVAIEEPSDCRKAQAFAPEFYIRFAPDHAVTRQTGAPHNILETDTALFAKLTNPSDTTLKRR